MALVLKDRVKETTTTTGTGTVTLAGAATGYQSFAAIGNGNTTWYCIAGQTGNEWEVGIGTYTSSGTTLSRDTVISSSNSGSLVSFSAGTKDVFCDFPAQAATVDIQTFTSSGTWTKPSAASQVRVIAIGGGGGGGSGRKGAAGSQRNGGGGGVQGMYSDVLLQASDLSSSETVTIGTGGTGGASQTTNSSNGNNGTAGGNTSFGSNVVSYGGFAGAGGAGTLTGANVTSSNFWSDNDIVKGGQGLFNTINPFLVTMTAATGYLAGAQVGIATTAGSGGGSYGKFGAGGGASGGCIGTGNTILGGASLYYNNAFNSNSGMGYGGNGAYFVNGGFAGGSASTTDGASGGNGTAATANQPYGGGGGGGGQASLTGNAGSGGAGALYGGGGGGGGASVDSTGNSGAGGNGAAGICVVISW